MRPTAACRLTGLLAVLTVLTGCSTVPSSSATVQITQAPTRPDDEVTIEPLSPEPGATPEQIVAGFIDAAASTVRGHPVARQYLTPEAADQWSDVDGITVIGPDYARVTTDAGRVAVTANTVGVIDERGVFAVRGHEVYTREFTLEEIRGEWRIADPPDGLLMLEPDFERLYDQLAVYFLDPTGQRVVPDPRYLITGASQPTVLVERLLAGPSSALNAGVRNPLAGVQLARTVAVEDQSAIVDLTGLPSDPAPQLSEISAQLVWTLSQLRTVRTVQLLVDGEPVDVEGAPAAQSTDDWASYDPDAAPVDAVGHYLDAGALHVVLGGRPVDGPAGTGAYGLSSAAVKADGRTWQLETLVAVSGRSLLVGPYGGDLTAVLPDAGVLSVPTVAATRGEAWVIRDGSEVVRVPFGGTPQAVNAPTLAGLGPARVLQLSPDGVRAALVIEGPEGRSLYLGTVFRAEDGSVALRDLRAIAPTLAQVVDVAWRDSETLLVLAGDAAQDRIVPYSVSVDGSGLEDETTSGLPSQPTSIGAAPSRLPLVSAGGTIWQLVGGTWSTLVRGEEPLPGTEPFFPL